MLRQQHAVSRVLDAAAAAKLDLSNVYVVGGVVRDLLIGKPVSDLDLSVVGDGPAFAERLASAMGGRALEYRGFGTAAVLVDSENAHEAVRIDVASARTETYSHPGALPDVDPAAGIVDDLRRRDFTVNAMAVSLDPDRGEGVVDPHDGVADLGRGVIRVLHDASFVDDPTRMFRAVRYAGRYHLALDQRTRQLLVDGVRTGAVATVSSARLRDELVLLLEEPAARAVELLGELGLAAVIDRRLRTDAQTLSHLQTIDQAMGTDPGRQALAWRMRLALVARDFDLDALRAWLGEMKLPARDVTAIADKVRVLHVLEHRHAELVASSPIELHRTFGKSTDETLELALLVAPTIAAREAVARFREHVEPVRLSVTGHDLLAMGIPRGPAVGDVLEDLYELKLAGEIGDDDAERERARELVAQRLEEA